MKRAIELMRDAGFSTLGLCSMLWVDDAGEFRAGLFRRDDRLHLAVSLGQERFWLVPVDAHWVGSCLRGERSLSWLANRGRGPICLSSRGIRKPGITDRLRARWRLRRAVTIPNAYYHWSQILPGSPTTAVR